MPEDLFNPKPLTRQYPSLSVTPEQTFDFPTLIGRVPVTRPQETQITNQDISVQRKPPFVQAMQALLFGLMRRPELGLAAQNQELQRQEQSFAQQAAPIQERNKLQFGLMGLDTREQIARTQAEGRMGIAQAQAESRSELEKYKAEQRAVLEKAKQEAIDERQKRSLAQKENAQSRAYEYAVNLTKLRGDLARGRISLQKQIGGVYVRMVDENGEIIGFFNPKTGDLVPSPVEGARAAPIPTAERNQRSALEVMGEQLGIVKDLINTPGGKAAVGPVSGSGIGKFVTERLPRTITGDTDEAVILRAATADISDQLLRARSGAQINEQEYQRLKALLPDVSTNIETFLARLQRFEQELNTVIQSRFRGRTTPQDTKKGLTPRRVITEP